MMDDNNNNSNFNNNKIIIIVINIVCDSLDFQLTLIDLVLSSG